jgi:hypothetical protein
MYAHHLAVAVIVSAATFDAARRSRQPTELKEKAPVQTGAFLIWQALEKPQWRLASG